MSGRDRQIRDNILDWTTTLVSFPTYRRVDEGDDPEFQHALSEAIEWIERWASCRGISLRNWNDRVLELTVGDGSPVTGIVAHLDVVPPGDESWEIEDPFDVVERDTEEGTVLIGRGVTDDKGPVASLLTVIERLQESPESFDGTVRLILDTAEEIGFDNMRAFFEANPDRHPDRSLVMDGYFPMVAGEKGLAWFDVDVDMSPAEDSPGEIQLLAIQGGDTINQVPGSATAKISLNQGQSDVVRESLTALSDAIRERLEVEVEGNTVVIRGRGTTGHGSAPQQGENALEPVIAFLTNLDGWSSRDRAVISFLGYLLDEENTYRYDGGWLGVDATDDRFETGTTLNLGRLSYENDRLTLGLDARLMPGQSPEDVIERASTTVEQLFDSAVDVSVTTEQTEPPLLIDPGDPFPDSALTAYRNVTGSPGAEPVYMGGRTDATVIPNSFAFGLMRYERASFYHFHGANERVYLEELVESAEIYYQTLTGERD